MNQETPIQTLLRLRQMTGRELSIKLGTTEGTISHWRRGLSVSEKRQKEIIRRLKLTDAELAEIGWKETVNG